MDAELVPFQPGKGSYDQQMRQALEKALEIHGTVINDLNQAMNCILQMERALGMVGAPNPYATVAQELKEKYGMGHKTQSDEWQKTQRELEAIRSLSKGEEVLELVEGEIVDGS